VEHRACAWALTRVLPHVWPSGRVIPARPRANALATYIFWTQPPARIRLARIRFDIIESRSTGWRHGSINFHHLSQRAAAESGHRRCWFSWGARLCRSDASRWPPADPRGGTGKRPAWHLICLGPDHITTAVVYALGRLSVPTHTIRGDLCRAVTKRFRGARSRCTVTWPRSMARSSPASASGPCRSPRHQARMGMTFVQKTSYPPAVWRRRSLAEGIGTSMLFRDPRNLRLPRAGHPSSRRLVDRRRRDAIIMVVAPDHRVLAESGPRIRAASSSHAVSRWSDALEPQLVPVYHPPRPCRARDSRRVTSTSSQATACREPAPMQSPPPIHARRSPADRLRRQMAVTTPTMKTSSRSRRCPQGGALTGLAASPGDLLR